MSISTTPASTPPLATHYTHGREAARYAAWEAAGLFAPRPAPERFATLLPPPNITGGLHLGHAYEHTLIDATTRFQRMNARETLWLPGLDHAGIATQALLERHLAAEGTSRRELGRDAFLARAHAWRAGTGETITAQMRAMGSSPDWSRSTYTLDAGPSLATHTAFTRLYDAGLVYRAERDTHWCTGCATTLSDIETAAGAGGLTCTRCHGAIEQRRSPQWYLATRQLADRARDALTSGALQIDPPSMAEEYLRWCDDLHDWCLSRQLWWGHRLPIWYDADGAAHSFAPGQPIPPGWTQDEDTLDTWFTSGLWPLATLGWPDPGADLDRYYPYDLLVTGYDLLFFWAIRMTMLCTWLSGTPPFRRLHLHGMIRDERGKKMSKSFGNTLDPAELIDELGPDTLRLALTRRARAGSDLAFGRSDLAGAEATTKKLWSTARLAQHLGLTLGEADEAGPSAHPLDRWLDSAFERAREHVTAGFAETDLGRAADSLVRFLQDDLSGLYLEARKPALRTDPAARSTLARCLRDLLLLLHPIAPFLTEELTAALGGPDSGLDLEPWPAARPELRDAEAEGAVAQLRDLLRQVRAHRAAHGLPPGRPLLAEGEELTCAEELFRLARLTPGAPGAEGTAELRSGGATLRLGGLAD